MRRGVVLAGVCLGWGTIPLVAAKADVAAPVLVFARVWIAAAGLGAFLTWRRAPGPRPFSLRPLRCLATGIVLAAHWTAMFAAYARAPDAAVIFLIFLAPVAIAVIERPAARLVVALVVAFAGFALVAGPAVDAATTRVRAGLFLALVAGALFVVLVLLAKPLAQVYGGLRLTFLEMVVAGAALVPAALVGDWSNAVEALPWLVLLGLVHTAIGTAVYLHTLAHVPATEVGILGYLEPVGVVLFAWLLAGERPAAATIAGGALVIAGGALAITTPTEVTVRVPG